MLIQLYFPLRWKRTVYHLGGVYYIHLTMEAYIYSVLLILANLWFIVNVLYKFLMLLSLISFFIYDKINKNTERRNSDV